MRESEDTPPLYVKETNGNASKVAQLKTLLRDLFREVFVQSVIDVNRDTALPSLCGPEESASIAIGGIYLLGAAIRHSRQG